MNDQTSDRPPIWVHRFVLIATAVCLTALALWGVRAQQAETLPKCVWDCQQPPTLPDWMDR